MCTGILSMMTVLGRESGTIRHFNQTLCSTVFDISLLVWTTYIQFMLSK